MKISELLGNPAYKKKAILEKLIRYKCSLTKEQMFMDIDKEIDDESAHWITNSYDAYINDDQPIEYILGHVDFLGVSFHVTSATLIPRPETEYMIEAVNERLSTHIQCETFFDIGTGCGVLGLSVLWHNPGQIKQVIMTDISEDALAVARINHDRLFTDRDEVTPVIKKANILDDGDITGLWKKCSTEGTPLLLVANLPYIPEKLFDDNTDISVKKWEPKFAFVGGDDGLDRYRVQFDQMIALQKETPVSCTQFLEMMTWQVEILVNEYGEIFTFEEVKTFHFNIRIVKVDWR